MFLQQPAAAAAVVFTLQFLSAVTLLYIQSDPTKKWKLKKYSEHGISKNASFSIKLNLVLVACDGVISDTWRTSNLSSTKWLDLK
jgi:hypothetical protein